MKKEEQLIMNEFWLPMECSESCNKCQKMFSPIALKYDCWNCHRLFCNKCTKFLPELFKFKQRVCELCQIYMKTNKTINSAYSSEVNHPKPSSLHQRPDENILDFVHELQPNVDSDLENSIKGFADEYVDYILDKYNQDNSWATSIKKLAFELVETVCPSVKFRSDLMDITKYVKFMQVPSSFNMCTFFQGGIISPVICENLPNTIENPKILYLDSKTVPKDTDPKELKLSFIEVADKYKPDLIVCSEILPELVLNELVERRVQWVLNVDLSQMVHIARITKGVILKSIKEADAITNFFGRCSRVEVKSAGTKTFICFLDVVDYTLGGTILIGGQNTEMITKVVKKILIALRNAKLERIFLFECGIKPNKQTLISQYSEDFCFKSLRVCDNKACCKLSTKTVKFYKKSDFNIGNFIHQLIYSSDELCNKCGLIFKSHKSYYFSNQVQVEISITDSKSINKLDYFLCFNCESCSKPLAPRFMSNATWEYSFHKFIKNFFTNISSFAQCSHCLFSQTFIFKHDQYQIQICPKPFQIFSVFFFSGSKFNSVFFENLLEETLKNTQIGAKFVLDRILDKSKILTKDINGEMAAVNATYNQLLPIRDKLLKIIEEIYTVMQDIFQPISTNFSSFLDIESIRRIIFLECCRFQTELETIKRKLKKLITIKSPNLPNTIFDEDLLQYFYKLKGGNLTLPMCKACFVPVYKDDPGSIVAYSLSSFKYYSDILGQNLNIEEILMSKSFQHWKFEVSTFEGMKIKDKFKSIYGSHYFFSVKAYCSAQFHCLRTGKLIKNEEFILSICKSVVKVENIGKSSSEFRVSHDSRFILKVVDRREAKMFLAMASGYFEHMRMNIFEGKLSIINVCMGLFKVNVKNIESGWSKELFLMIFDNIGNGLVGPCSVYDLKGTSNKRRRVKEGGKQSKMDLNFIEDFKSIPLPISKSEMNRLTLSIQNDTTFLSKHNVIDYSLLLMINLSDRKIVVALIDYIQKYTIDKILENKYKAMLGSEDPTIVNPESYKERFCDTIFYHYFIVVDE